MIHRLQEIQSIYISQNRLVEGKDYKRAEWLKGTGGCYIDTLINPAWNDQLSATTEVSGRPTVGNPCILHASGSNTRVEMVLGGAWYKDNTTQFLVKNRVVGTNDYIEWENFPANAELYASFKVVNNSIPTVSFKVNGASLTYKYINGSSIITELPDTTYKIGDAAANGLDVLNLKNIKINSHNFVPCRLLHSIPRNLDAQYKSRIAGECGMIDLISGKFYGNVASSGSFSVEGLDESGTVEDTRLHQIYTNKLVEGEDYEIGEMLKADIPISTSMMTLPINSRSFEFKRNWIQIMNSSYFTTFDFNTNTNYSYFIPDHAYTYTDLRLKPMIWSMGFSQYISSHKLGLGIHTIVANDNEVTISSATDTATLPWYGEPVGIRFSNAANENKKTICLTSSIKVDGVIRYVPCQLLKSIPRNLDAQCKERVAGECGMIDLISGRFYGNVASSGTFSLAWDEWLKDCSIQFNPEATLEYSTSIPNDYVIYGRIEVAKLTAQYTDFGFMQASNNYIILGESTVYVISDWGTNKWATFVVSYSGGYECSLQLNGVTLTTITSSTPYNEAPHIQLHGIMQINKIEHTSYPDESDPTQSQSEVWKRFVEEDGRQGLGITDMTYKIYAD